MCVTSTGGSNSIVYVVLYNLVFFFFITINSSSRGSFLVCVVCQHHHNFLRGPRKGRVLNPVFTKKASGKSPISGQFDKKLFRRHAFPKGL